MARRLIDLCREHAVEPDVELRTMTFDLGYGPIQRSEAVAIVSESSALGLPDELCWVPLEPSVGLEVGLLVRSHDRAPVVDRIQAAAVRVSASLGWT